MTRLLTITAAIVAFAFQKLPNSTHVYAISVICIATAISVLIFVTDRSEDTQVIASVDSEAPSRTQDLVVLKDALGGAGAVTQLAEGVSDPTETHYFHQAYKQVLVRWTHYSIEAYQQEERKRAVAVESALYIARQLNAPNFEVRLTPDHEIIIRKCSEEEVALADVAGGILPAVAKPELVN